MSRRAALPGSTAFELEIVLAHADQLSSAKNRRPRNWSLPDSAFHPEPVR